MANTQPQPNVEISGRAFSYLTAISIPIILAVAAGLFRGYAATVQLADRLDAFEFRIERLEEYGPGSGKRFTARDGEKHDDRLALLEGWRHRHGDAAGQLIGRYNTLLNEHGFRLDALEGRFRGNGKNGDH